MESCRKNHEQGLEAAAFVIMITISLSPFSTFSFLISSAVLGTFPVPFTALQIPRENSLVQLVKAQRLPDVTRKKRAECS